MLGRALGPQQFVPDSMARQARLEGSLRSISLTFNVLHQETTTPSLAGRIMNALHLGADNEVPPQDEQSTGAPLFSRQDLLAL